MIRVFFLFLYNFYNTVFSIPNPEDLSLATDK